jgi:hypothetical protein
MKFGKCLIITRHQLLQQQLQDIQSICEQHTVIPEFPQSQQEQKTLLQAYDAVIGVLPVNLIQSVQNAGKTFITFAMKSLGTMKTQTEIDQLVNKYGNDRIAILAPSKPEEPYRVTLYQGLKAIRVIVEETPIITHDT